MTVLLPPFNLDGFSFSSLAVARTSNAMLNRSGESGHPCLIHDLSGKHLSCCPLSMMFALHLLYIAFIMLRNAPSIPTLLIVFIINGYCTLLNAFSTSIIRSCDFCFAVVYVIYYVY